MNLHEYKNASARDMARAVITGTATAEETARLALDLAESEGRELNAVVTLCTDQALAQARRVDAQIREGKVPGALAGVPVMIKDNISLKGIPLTCASRILAGYTPVYDATCVERLLASGALIVATTNMDEFGMGSSNENSIYGPVLNPRADGYVPGGSSGGSAAAVAAGLVPIALGSDTGGSVRQPAAFCGVVGLRPTYGAVSRYGLVAFASSFDQIGPLTRSVDDCSLAFEAIAGFDERDATSAPDRSGRYETIIAGKEKTKYRVGILPAENTEGMDEEIAEVFGQAVGALRNDGHIISVIDSGHLDYAVASYYLIANAEASANLARFDGIRFGNPADETKNIEALYEGTRGEGFGREVKRRIMLGTFALSTGYYDKYYIKAQKVRELIRADFERAFHDVDIIVSPTTPTAAFRFGEKLDDPLTMYLSDILTVQASLAAIPAISIPCGFVSDGRPAGLQIMAPRFREDLLFQAALTMENIISRS
jgi:aspartyl-tRNA(Asn)/glutamyl-tRNA(Gln) amidotransferase subunit A